MEQKKTTKLVIALVIGLAIGILLTVGYYVSYIGDATPALAQAKPDLPAVDSEALNQEYTRGYNEGKAASDASLQEQYDKGYSDGVVDGLSQSGVYLDDHPDSYPYDPETATGEESEPEPEPEPVPEVTYIANTNTGKFHYPGCYSVDAMKEYNKKYYYGDRAEVVSDGFKPCGNCNP